MIIPIESEIIIADEWHRSTLTHLRVDLTDQMITWIKKMMKVVKKNKVAYLADYECSPEFFYKDDDDELEPCEDDLDCVMIIVTKDEFYWEGLIKHTEIHFESTAIPITLIDDLIKFSQDSEELENLPKYINDKDYSKREIALRRMRSDL